MPKAPPSSPSKACTSAAPYPTHSPGKDARVFQEAATPDHDEHSLSALYVSGPVSEAAEVDASASELQPKAAVWEVPSIRQLRQQYGKDFGNTCITGWDAWEYFKTHRDRIAEAKLPSAGHKKLYLNHVYALAKFDQRVDADAAAREFLDKNAGVRANILGSLGLGLCCMDWDDGDYGEHGNSNPDTEDYYDQEERDFIDSANCEGPPDEVLRQWNREAVREKKREQLGSEYDSEEDYGSVDSDEVALAQAEWDAAGCEGYDEDDW